MLMDSIGRYFEDIWTSIYKFISKSILNTSMYLQKYSNASLYSVFSIFKYICKKYLVFSIQIHLKHVFSN